MSRKFSQQIKHPKMKNYKMDDSIYKLRRKVIDLIYEIKSIYPQLPRINVRITSQHLEKPTILGSSSMDTEYIIWIPIDSTSEPKNILRYITFHEVLHTVFGVEHDKRATDLMDSRIHRDKTKEQIHSMFLKEIKNIKKQPKNFN